jgi:hypothetical protein
MRLSRKKKSGHPGSALAPSVQPVIRFLIKYARRRNSVVVLELAFTARILRLRLGVVLNG